MEKIEIILNWTLGPAITWIVLLFSVKKYLVY